MMAKETGLESAGLDKGGACSAHRSAVCNILPHVEKIVQAGFTSGDAGVLTFQAACVAYLAALPFGIGKIRGICGAAWPCCGLVPSP